MTTHKPITDRQHRENRKRIILNQMTAVEKTMERMESRWDRFPEASEAQWQAACDTLAKLGSEFRSLDAEA